MSSLETFHKNSGEDSQTDADWGKSESCKQIQPILD